MADDDREILKPSGAKTYQPPITKNKKYQTLLLVFFFTMRRQFLSLFPSLPPSPLSELALVTYCDSGWQQRCILSRIPCSLLERERESSPQSYRGNILTVTGYWNAYGKFVQILFLYFRASAIIGICYIIFMEKTQKITQTPKYDVRRIVKLSINFDKLKTINLNETLLHALII